MVIKYFKIILSFFLKLFGEKRFAYSVKVFPASIKSIKSIQKYSHIIESYARILKIFVVIDKEQSINALISFRICSTSKESKDVTSILRTYKATQWVPTWEYSSRFITWAPSFILGKLSLEQASLNLGSFWYYFCISKFVKGWGGIKNPFWCFFYLFCFRNQLLQSLHLLYLFLYLLKYKLAPNVFNNMKSAFLFFSFILNCFSNSFW